MDWHYLTKLVKPAYDSSMDIVNTYEAKTHLSRLIERAAAGEEIIIAKSGKPVARLVGYAQPAGPRAGGHWKGQVRMAEDFDAPLPPDVAGSFCGLDP